MSMIEKNNENINPPIITMKDRVRSFYRSRAITTKQRVLSIKALPKKDEIALKPIVLNLNMDSKKILPFT